MRGLIATAVGLVAVGCSTTPSGMGDAGVPDLDGPSEASPPRITVQMDHPFGDEGEVPGHLVLGDGDRLLAWTDRAVYQMDRQGRALHRWDLPATAAGARAVVTSVQWDGSGSGATVRWGNGDMAAGTYLALTDAQGMFDPFQMQRLGSPTSAARTLWDGRSHQVIWSEPNQGLVDLKLGTFLRQGPKSVTTLASGLPSTTALGGWIGQGPSRAALCTVEQGAVKLRMVASGQLQPALVINEPQRRAVGTCQLATSGRSILVTWTQQALAPELVDAGLNPRPPDLGPGSLTFNILLGRVVDPGGQALTRAVRLSLFEGTVRVESVLWRGQYLVLVNAAGYRGGRLALTALNESGDLSFRDNVIPLDYEPGRLMAGRLCSTATGYLLLYGSRRPWDEGILHLARLGIDQ